jgi:hypothetical protein
VNWFFPELFVISVVTKIFRCMTVQRVSVESFHTKVKLRNTFESAILLLRTMDFEIVICTLSDSHGLSNCHSASDNHGF